MECPCCGFLSTIRKIFFFFFNDTATTELYTLSLHDALPIRTADYGAATSGPAAAARHRDESDSPDRKSTRLNSSHLKISYAVFCLKKKKIRCLYCFVKIKDKRVIGGG